MLRMDFQYGVQLFNTRSWSTPPFAQSLFKVTGITHEERCANLCALLVDDGTCSQIMPLPTNADVESVVKFSPLSNTTNDIKEENFVVGNYYATLLKEGSANTWYIASCEQQNDNGTYRMDHIM